VLRLASATHPAALQADLNGDGIKEVLLVTHSLQLHLIAPQPPTRASQGFAPAIVKGKQPVEVSSVLLGDKQPVALAAGYIDAPADDMVHAPRKMVVVIVTAGWLVICLDHNLNVLWEKSVHGHFPHHASMREVRAWFVASCSYCNCGTSCPKIGWLKEHAHSLRHSLFLYTFFSGS
jgi:hypothetical protein